MIFLVDEIKALTITFLIDEIKTLIITFLKIDLKNFSRIDDRNNR